MWTGFQTGGRIREKGLNEKRIPSQRTGPVKKKKPILTPKSQAESQPAKTHTHTNAHTPPDPTVFFKSHQPKPNTTLYNPYYYLHQLSISHSLSQQSEPAGEPVVPISPSTRYELNGCSAQIESWIQMPLVSNSILLCLRLCHYRSLADIIYCLRYTHLHTYNIS